MYRAKYIVCNDLDELIVPRCNGCADWSLMMNNITKICPTQSHYAFSHAYFKENKPELIRYFNESFANDIGDIDIIASIVRQEFLYPRRSKYIVNPRGIEYLRIHKLNAPRASSHLQSTAVYV